MRVLLDDGGLGTSLRHHNNSPPLFKLAGVLVVVALPMR